MAKAVEPIEDESPRAIPWKMIVRTILLLIAGALGGSTAKVALDREDAPAADAPFEVKLIGPANTTQGFAVVVDAPADAVKRWRNQLPAGEQPALELTDNAGRLVLANFAPLPGEHIYELSAQKPVDGLDPFAESRLRVFVGPTPATKPVEKPTNPSVPEPPVAPADPSAPGVPVSFQGVKVLFINESGERPVWFYDLTASPAVAAYLSSHCDGGANGWRVWDIDEPALNAHEDLRELAGIPGTKPNSVTIAAKGRAYGFQLTKDTSESDLLSLLKKYGGA